MEHLKDLEWGSLSEDYASGCIPPGVGIQVNQDKTVFNITYSQTEIESSWVDVVGLAFASAMSAYHKDDIILSNCGSEFFFDGTVFAMWTIKVSDAWNERISRGDCVKTTPDGDIIMQHPLLARNTITFVGETSNVLSSKIFDRRDGNMLIDIDTTNINFNRETRKKEPLPETFKTRMLEGINNRHETNARISQLKFPINFTILSSQQIQATADHIDNNSHVNFKLYTFLGIKVLRSSVEKGLLKHRSLNKAQDIVVQGMTIVFLQEAMEGDVLRCDILETPDEEALYAAMYRADTRLAYCQLTLNHSYKRLTSNL